MDLYCCYCCAPGGTYAGGLGFQERLGVVLLVGILGVAILGISWWPIFAHNICMFSHQIPY